MFPNGNSLCLVYIMRLTPEKLGGFVKTARQQMGVTQRSLALTSGTGLRFIIELEKGKPTCQLGKVLAVINTLGIDIALRWPDAGKPADYSSSGE
jgi:HTH-type transcriptional regulator / antitoxin HipB